MGGAVNSDNIPNFQNMSPARQQERLDEQARLRSNMMNYINNRFGPTRVGQVQNFINNQMVLQQQRAAEIRKQAEASAAIRAQERANRPVTPTPVTPTPVPPTFPVTPTPVTPTPVTPTPVTPTPVTPTPVTPTPVTPTPITPPSFPGIITAPYTPSFNSSINTPPVTSAPEMTSPFPGIIAAPYRPMARGGIAKLRRKK